MIQKYDRKYKNVNTLSNLCYYILDINIFVEYIVGDSIIKIGTNAFADIQKFRIEAYIY